MRRVLDRDGCRGHDGIDLVPESGDLLVAVTATHAQRRPDDNFGKLAARVASWMANVRLSPASIVKLSEIRC
jgi:hypothetical protein